jgi:hypothetical protein
VCVVVVNVLVMSLSDNARSGIVVLPEYYLDIICDRCETSCSSTLYVVVYDDRVP